jgi:hypothetical protein
MALVVRVAVSVFFKFRAVACPPVQHKQNPCLVTVPRDGSGMLPSVEIRLRHGHDRLDLKTEVAQPCEVNLMNTKGEHIGDTGTKHGHRHDRLNTKKRWAT